MTASAISSPTGERAIGPENLEASHTARLAQRGRTEEIDVADVPVPERAELLDVYRDRYGKMPTVGSTLDALPEPADHPMFRIIASRPAA